MVSNKFEKWDRKIWDKVANLLKKNQRSWSYVAVVLIIKISVSKILFSSADLYSIFNILKSTQITKVPTKNLLSIIYFFDLPMKSYLVITWCLQWCN